MRVRIRNFIPFVGSRAPHAAIPNYSQNLHGSRSPLAHVLKGTYTERDFRKHVTQIERKSRPFAIIKPGRKLPAPWMDDFIGQRLGISLCESCLRRYGWRGWCSRYNYKPLWQPRPLADCDACGNFLYCIGFWPCEHTTPWAFCTATSYGDAANW